MTLFSRVGGQVEKNDHANGNVMCRNNENARTMVPRMIMATTLPYVT